MFDCFKHLRKNVISGIIISEREKGQKTNKMAKNLHGLYFLPFFQEISIQRWKTLKTRKDKFMPNCCYGSLTISANNDRIKEIKSMLLGTGDDNGNPFDFNKVIPMPENIYRGSLGMEGKELYGKNNWYDWSIENWGTKWNSCDTEEYDDGFTFWTAWSPCTPVIEELARMFPDASFDYSYDESGVGFCGEERYENGKLVYIMEADFSERWNDDEDDPIPDFEDGYEETCIEENEYYRIVKFIRRSDEVDYRTIVDGMFCEGSEDNLREKLYEKLYGKEPTLR